MKEKSLKARKSKLSDTKYQLETLSNGLFKTGELDTFSEKLRQHNRFPLKPTKIEILQINVGYMCNQVCAHCHVDAGPDRKEIMTKETMMQCLDIIKQLDIHTVDLTGGAPEMNPNFRWFAREIIKAGTKELIVRSNLTIVEANKKYHDLPVFFKDLGIHVISSMPHWTKGKTDIQRGNGVFDKSIRVLKQLNETGYGIANSPLQLDLVYNPSGAFLPGNQADLEKEFKTALKNDFGIRFHNLFTITNLPISRFLDYLIVSDNYEAYMHTLVDAFNPNTLDGVMCINTLSVDWQGYLYDCDFNQMLKLGVGGKSKHISKFDILELHNRAIKTHQHCFGCTAGSGSSCQGTLV